MDYMEKKKQFSVVQEKIGASDYQMDHYTVSEQRRQTQSGNWILQNELFRAWANPDLEHPPVLYINGIPGAGTTNLLRFWSELANMALKGKSTLASHIIEGLLEDSTQATLFFYCKHDTPTKDNFKSILRALIVQLACKDSTVTSYIYEECCKRDPAGISTALEQLAKDVFDTQAKLFIVLDGLDECEPEEVQKALSWFIDRQKTTDYSGHTRIRLLCVSQRTEVIERMLSETPQLSLENPHHELDVRQFVKQQASLIEDEFRIGSEVEAQITTRVSNTAKSKFISSLYTVRSLTNNSNHPGMFLFAKLVMQNLQNQTSRYDLMKELEPEVFPVNLQDA